MAALEERLAQVEARLTVREDELDVRKLQHLYGYLIDKCLYNETVYLFTPDGEVRFFGGTGKGKEGIRRLYVERFQSASLMATMARSTASCWTIRSCRTSSTSSPTA